MKMYEALSPAERDLLDIENFKKKKNKKLARRWNNLLKLLNSIDGKHDFFLTLIYPSWYSADEIIDRIRDDINNFGDRFRYHYKGGWAIYSIEFKHSVKIHIHIIGKLKNGFRSLSKQRCRFENRVYQWWARFVGSDDERLSNVKFVDTKKGRDAFKGYLRKAGKTLNFRILSKLVEGKLKYTHGMINRKFMPRASKEFFQIPDDVFDKHIRPFLIEDANKAGKLKNKFHQQNLRSKDYGFHILKQRKAIEKILKKYRVGAK